MNMTSKQYCNKLCLDCVWISGTQHTLKSSSPQSPMAVVMDLAAVLLEVFALIPVQNYKFGQV